MGFPSDAKILTVDDMATMRKIIKSLLTQLGYTNVDEAENGKEALAKLKQQKYDLVLLDWNMPEMDGITLLQEIKKRPRFEKYTGYNGYS